LRGRMRTIVAKRGPGRLHEILKRLDPENAKRIEPADTQKIIRAIELRLLAGKTVGEIHAAGRDPLQGYAIVKIGLAPPRPALYARIHERIDAMIAAGWIDEVRHLMNSGVPESAKAFQFIGYSQWRDFLNGKLKREDALEEIRKATRHFAKRQQTWFRREANVHWIEGFGGEDFVESDARKFISI
jgi:tRNA dimethylallyltransferase